MIKPRVIKKDEVPQEYKEPFKVRPVPSHTIREMRASDTKKVEEPRTAFNALFLT